MKHPHSPEEVIDPRWDRYLHARHPRQAAPAARAGGPGADDPWGHEPEADGGPGMEPAHRGVQPAHHASDAELNAEIARVLEPWRTGKAGPRSTLEGLRELAERRL